MIQTFSVAFIFNKNGLDPLCFLLILQNISKFLFSRTSCKRLLLKLPRENNIKEEKIKSKSVNLYLDIHYGLFFFSDIFHNSFKITGLNQYIKEKLHTIEIIEVVIATSRNCVIFQLKRMYLSVSRQCGTFSKEFF